MNRLIERTLWMALAFAFAATGMGVTPAAAQEAGAGQRITIMVPDLAPQAGAKDNFGEDVAEELRDLIADLHTHQTVSGKDLNRARKDYDLEREDLYNCINARQLAMRMSWGLVLCGEYEKVGDRQVRVSAKFVGAQDGNEFEVPTFQASERDPEQAARTILQTFDKWQTQLRHVVFCQQYMDSQDWDSALRNCDQALEINPTASAMYMKAFILRETDRPEEALAMLDQLLEKDPIHQDALKLAGITATEAGMVDRAKTYFDRYMELNPGDVDVRLALATDMSKAGNPAAALEFALGGLESEPTNMTLRTYIGHFAAQAAAKAESTLNAQQQGNAEAGTPAVDPAQVTEFYQTAADSYQMVYDSLGAETDPQILERLTVSLFKLGQMDAAVQLGQEAVELDPENPELWDAYSRALQESGDANGALSALEKAQELGKSSPAMIQRRAMIQLDQGNERAAIAALSDGVQAGDLDASNAFNIIFAKAYRDNFQRGRLDPAYELLEAAGPLAVAEKDKLTRNFWRGYIMFEKAKAAHEPMTAASAQQAKPLFERALELFQAARGYERYHESANVPQFIDQAKRFIEIEEALIKRGR
jgi:tetratricopeptide (TPR) repeat protein